LKDITQTIELFMFKLISSELCNTGMGLSKDPSRETNNDMSEDYDPLQINSSYQPMVFSRKYLLKQNYICLNPTIKFLCIYDKFTTLI